MLQIGVVPEQSLLPTHAMQSPLPTSQMGVGALHWVEVVHATHLPVCAPLIAQNGDVTVRAQSRFELHARHMCDIASQIGVDGVALQSALVTHAANAGSETNAAATAASERKSDRPKLVIVTSKMAASRRAE
jgi:hypothetical protein